jgi:hypothetical protein
MMILRLKVLFALAGLVLISACAVTSPTEADFGNSARNLIAKQQMPATGPLKADEPITVGDGRRLENVNTTYQTHVGDPQPGGSTRHRQIKVEGK